MVALIFLNREMAVSSTTLHVSYSPPYQAILLDIEGTTTPVAYVFEVLFPFARDRVADFLRDRGSDAAVQADLQQLRAEYEADLSQGQSLPTWQGAGATAAVPYIQHLIAIDRKSTGLKSLQGKIWELGYRDGRLRSQLFPDVKPALQRWTAAGKKLFIFSSGSVQAQQLIFRYSEAGDLTSYLSGYFDTQTGPKKVAESYQNIAAVMGLPPGKILFVSDVTAELKAAQTAGMETLFSNRPGNHSSDPEGFPSIQTFDEI